MIVLSAAHHKNALTDCGADCDDAEGGNKNRPAIFDQIGDLFDCVALEHNCNDVVDPAENYKEIGGRNKVEKVFNKPIFLVLDCSGSMAGEKIDVLNDAVMDMIDDFKSERLSDINIQMCIITFGEQARLHTDLCSIYNIEYEKLTANGLTPLGGALNILTNIIEDKEKVSSKGYRPTIVLISDGHPNDEWEEPLERFLTGKRTSKCECWALGIGQDADYQLLKRFLENNSGKEVFDASVAKEISKFFKFVTMSTIARTKSVNPNEIIDVKELEEMFNQDKPNFDF